MSPIASRARRRVRACMLALASASWVSGEAVAQDPACAPQTPGQWLGPFDLSLDPAFNSAFHEIAAAAVLPCDEPAVLFWCEDVCGGVGHTDTYLWRADAPAQVELIRGDVTTNPYTMFCCGLTWLADGRLLVAGGTNYQQGCPVGNPNFGHNRGFLFDPFGRGGPGWTAILSLPGGNLMGHQRWYPTVTPLADGRALILGHDELPEFDQIDHFELYDPTAYFQGSRLNRTFDTPAKPGACDDATILKVADYPRVHQLASGLAFWSDGNVKSGSPFCGIPPGPCPVAAFFDYTTDFQCAAAPSKERWRVYAQSDPAVIFRDQPNSIHLLWPDDDPALGYREAIYLIAGRRRTPPDPTTNVDRIVDPDPQNNQWDPSPPDLNHPRVECNTVIGLDGSLFTFGGETLPIGGVIQPMLEPERMFPPELLGGQGVWIPLASQEVVREYHSVAGLLPDGRIFVAGGEDRFGGFFGNPEHTVEVYLPPYLFMGPRPRIELARTDWRYGGKHRVEYASPTGRPIARAALIRNGSVTHAFDSSQRYVGLRFTDLGGALSITAPPDGNVAPPGYYMLVIVDTCGVPSQARFIHLG